MKDKIKQIYDLLYSPIVTPFNLLENAKLKNYEYVKYYMEESFFIAEMKCNDFSNEGTIFYYYFDEKNYLERIFKQQNTDKVLLFDRKQEAEKQKEEFLNSKTISTKVV